MTGNRVKMFLGITNMFLIMRATASNITFIWLLFCLCSLLFIVKSVSFCKGHENIWLFILTMIGTIPMNIKVTNLILELDVLNSGVPIIGPIIATIEAYLLVLAFEEIIIGIIGRMLFKKQYAFEEE